MSLQLDMELIEAAVVQLRGLLQRPDWLEHPTLIAAVVALDRELPDRRDLTTLLTWAAAFELLYEAMAETDPLRSLVLAQCNSLRWRASFLLPLSGLEES